MFLVDTCAVDICVVGYVQRYKCGGYVVSIFVVSVRVVGICVVVMGILVLATFVAGIGAVSRVSIGICLIPTICLRLNTTYIPLPTVYMPTSLDIYLPHNSVGVEVCVV